MSWAEAPMQKQWGIYYGRLQRFLSNNYYEEENITGSLVEQSSEDGISICVWSPSPNKDDSHISFSEAQSATYSKTEVGESFGPSWSTHWFRITIESPLADEPNVHFHWKSQSEGLVWTEDGKPVQGTSAQDRFDFPLGLVKPSKGRVTFYIEMACNGMFGNGGSGGMISPPDENRKYRIEECDLRLFNKNAVRLYRDLQILQDMAGTFGEGHVQGKKALFTANHVINTFNNPCEGSKEQSLIRAQEIVNNFLRSSELKASDTVVFAVGNCHIDTAWLWRYKETRRKTARSWSSQLALMDAHPEYIFVASQMQQLDWLYIDYPNLFLRIQEYVKTGQFIPIGGSWVEMDGNLPSGESFARQFLYGQKFMLEHFGKVSDIFWLPDTFGYNAQLPQLMSLAGMKYFVTQKLSWNNINKFPHNSLHWEGIDGTKVLAHFPPSNTYTSSASAGDAIRSEKDHKDIDRSRHALLLYGHGDGGGGPTDEMISRLKQMRDSTKLPVIEFTTPSTFFTKLEKDASKLLTWRGELYFELHRGTYTSQSTTKYYNRKCEILLREAEMLSVINGLVSNNLLGMYPGEELERLWKNVLLNQFHDVLPGSSIGPVYDDALRLYEDAQFKAVKLRDDAMNNMFGNKVGGSEVEEIKPVEKGIVFFNTTPYTRCDVIIVPYDGDEDSPQPGVLAVADIHGFSMASFDQSRIPLLLQEKSSNCSVLKTQSHYIMENGFVTIHIDEVGHITSFYDKKMKRELIPSGGKANRFMVYEDIPFYWDAWDVELHHLEKGWCVSDDPSKITLSVGMEGPLLVSLLRVIRISDQSMIFQVISLDFLNKRLDFTCRVEWHESHKLLKVEFPVDVHSDFATYECPFGMVARPTHFNTSWDVARFEVCGHRFADLSEYDYGVALINDCKYGYSIRGNLMQMSLLRSPKMPDDECDMGTHLMRFALFPHTGNISTGQVLEEAVKFNTPLLWTSASPVLYDYRWLNQPVLQFSHPDVRMESLVPLSIEAIKLAEDGSGDVVIRAYEPRGGRGMAKLNSHELIILESLQCCDLLERPLTHGYIKDGLVEFKPYQIITLRAKIKLSPDAWPPHHKTPNNETSSSSESSFESLH